MMTRREIENHLKKCPFCGNDYNVYLYQREDGKVWLYEITCFGCYLVKSTGTVLSEKAMQNMIDKLNKRAEVMP